VEPKGNAILITKQASGSAKIDPLMATFNAVSLMALNPASTNLDAFLNNPVFG
jgi:phage terminase large subunit-like protein